MLYRERRSQPGWLLFLALLLTISLGIAYAAATTSTFGSIIGASLNIPAVVLWWKSSSNITVTEEHLLVGRLKLELSVIASATVLEPEQFLRRIRTDAKTTDLLLFTRTDIGGVDFELNDPSDPYRSWVISSRNPQQLADAVNQSRGNRLAHQERL